jgi:hypothetical protein
VLVEALAFAQLLLVLGLLLGEVVDEDLLVDDVFELLAVQVVLLELELDRGDRLSAGLGERGLLRLPRGAASRGRGGSAPP